MNRVQNIKAQKLIIDVKAKYFEFFYLKSKFAKRNLMKTLDKKIENN